MAKHLYTPVKTPLESRFYSKQNKTILIVHLPNIALEAFSLGTIKVAKG